MRSITSLLLAAALALPATGLAAPLVIQHVPDFTIPEYAGSDVQLESERAAVARAEHAIVTTKAGREEHRAKYREALHERHQARKADRDSERQLRKAARADRRMAQPTRTVISADGERFEAEQHVAWHREQLRAQHARLRADRAARSAAAARLELAQARLLDEHGNWVIWGPRTYERQVERIDRKVQLRDAELEAARAEVRRERTEYVASND